LDWQFCARIAWVEARSDRGASGFGNAKVDHGEPHGRNGQSLCGLDTGLYATFLEPLLFEPYAVDLAERVAHVSPRDVLETAAGTGVVTRALGRVLPTSVALTATDLNQAMIDFAASRPQPSRATWRQADAARLPFDGEVFDVVVCQFGAMFFPDKVSAFREAFRVLKPGGQFIFNVWDRLEENDFPFVVDQAVAALFPEDPPHFLARTPHGHHDTATIRDALHAAGFVDIEIETVERLSRAPSPQHVATGFCQGSPLRNEIEARDKDGLVRATDAAAAALASRFGTGPVEGRMRAHVITAAE
jgi:ubiquinone/menaquinone biosynthesis C-methylase UbiE